MENNKKYKNWKVGEIHGLIKLIGVNRQIDKMSETHREKMWVCQCMRCGRIFVTCTTNITRYGARGCYSCRIKDSDGERIEKIKQHIGEKYGELEILDFAGFRNDNRGRRYPTVLCRCSCGRETVQRLNRILNGQTTHCKYCRQKNLSKGVELVKMASVEGTNVLSIRNNTVNVNSSTGVKGVTYNKRSQKYRAYIYFKGKQYDLGLHDSLDEAAEVRKAAEKELFGNFLEWYAETFPNQWARLEKTGKKKKEE